MDGYSGGDLSTITQASCRADTIYKLYNNQSFPPIWGQHFFFVRLRPSHRQGASHNERDILALAGPSLEDRRELFDFIVEELALREHLDSARIRPVRAARLTLQGIELMHMIKKGQMVAGESQGLSAAGQFYSLAA